MWQRAKAETSEIETPRVSGEGLGARQATEQTCSLDVESVGPGLQHTPSLSIWEKLSPFPLSSGTQGQAKVRRRTDWQPGFDFIVTTAEDDIPVLCAGGGVRPFQHPARGGVCEIKDVTTSHLGQFPVSLTKSSCTCLPGTPDSSNSSSLLNLFYSFFARHHFYQWEMVSHAEKDRTHFLVIALSLLLALASGDDISVA